MQSNPFLNGHFCNEYASFLNKFNKTRGVLFTIGRALLHLKNVHVWGCA